ncbi:MAG TPA: MFS transporter [Gaiellaceae bacterium]
MARKWWTLMTVSIATFMLLLDVTIVNVALPAIERDLGASLTDLEWVVDSYVLALAALTLMAGALADRLGRKLVFTAGLAGFTAASLLAGFAGDALTLNLARGLQGIGGAAMFGTVLALIAQEFGPRERKTALGIWGATVGVGVAVGPLVGGVLVDSLGWESIFFVNVPVGALTILLALTKLREARDPSPGRLDWGGLGTFSGALLLLVLGLLRGNGEGWLSPEIVGSLAGGAALLAAFTAIELSQRNPMLDLRLFRVPAFTGASLASFAVASSVFSMLLYIVLYLQNVLGLSPLQAGVRLLPITAMAFFFSPLAARLSQRVPLRALIGVGLALAGVGLLVAGGLDADSEWTALLAGLLLIGAGVGLVNPSVAEAAIGVVPTARAATGAAINNTFRQVGVAVGIAALGAVFQGRIESRLGDLLANGPPAYQGQAGELAPAVSSGNTEAAVAAAPPQAQAFLAHAAREAFLSGLNEIFLIAGVTALIGAALSLLLIRARDLQLDAHEESASRLEDTDESAEQPALAA